MQLGDIRISEISLGGINLNRQEIHAYAFNIHEDILDYYGPKAELRIHDYADIIGNAGLNGSYDQDLVIRFSEYYSGAEVSMNFKLYENANMGDRAGEEGSGRMKQYDLRCVMPELLNAGGNYVNRSFVDYTTNITKTILEENLLTERNVEIQETSSNNRRFTFNQRHPREVLGVLNDEHIGTESSSSAFVAYQNHKNGDSKYVITTFEKLFQQTPRTNLIRSSEVSFSTATIDLLVNSIRSFNVNSSFFTRDRYEARTISRSYNMSTGVLHDQTNPQRQSFRVLGRNVFNAPPRYVNNNPAEVTLYDSANDPTSITIAQARANRRQFLTYLTENHGTFEIHGNPSITLGDVVNLTIPNLSAQGGSQERIFSGPALVVSITHKIQPVGVQPRYTMILGLVKAGYSQVSGGSA
jgi:hypothetical protein